MPPKRKAAAATAATSTSDAQPAASSSGAPLPPAEPKDAAAGFFGALPLTGDVVQQKPAKKSKKNVLQSWEDTVLDTLRRVLPAHLYARLHTEGKAPTTAAVFKAGGLLVHVSPFGMGGEGALRDDDDNYDLLPTLEPVADDSLEMWIEPRSYDKAAIEDMRYGRATFAPRFAWTSTAPLESLGHICERGMNPGDGSGAAPGFCIFLLAPAAGADYLSFDNALKQGSAHFAKSATGFCVRTSDCGAPMGRAAIEISRDGTRAALRYCTVPTDDPKAQLASVRGGYDGFDDYYERGVLPAIKLALEKHPETLVKLPLEGDAVSSARVLDKGDGFLVHVLQRQIDANGLDMLPNLDLPKDGSGVPCVEARTLTHADLKALLYAGAPTDGTRRLWTGTHIRDALRHVHENAEMPFPRAYTILCIDASHPAFPWFNSADGGGDGSGGGSFATSLRSISTSDDNSGLVVLEVTAPSAGPTRALLRRHSIGEDPASVLAAQRPIIPDDVLYACDSCGAVRDVIWLHSQEGAMVVSQPCPHRKCVPKGVTRLSRRSSDDGRPIALGKDELKETNVKTIGHTSAAGRKGYPVLR